MVVRSNRAALLPCAQGSNVSWPFVLESTQIRSRGSASSLLAGTLIAVPSGFAVVLAITSGGSQNALTGVAIAAALLPPGVNAGLCWALAFWWQTIDPQANWWRDLGEVSSVGMTRVAMAVWAIIWLTAAAVPVMIIMRGDGWSRLWLPLPSLL